MQHWYGAPFIHRHNLLTRALLMTWWIKGPPGLTGTAGERRGRRLPGTRVVDDAILYKDCLTCGRAMEKVPFNLEYSTYEFIQQQHVSSSQAFTLPTTAAGITTTTTYAHFSIINILLLLLLLFFIFVFFGGRGGFDGVAFERFRFNYMLTCASFYNITFKEHW